jgi:hypothetical protein
MNIVSKSTCALVFLVLVLSRPSRANRGDFEASEENEEENSVWSEDAFEFKTEIVPDEYIVAFDGYYSAADRLSFISRSLGNSSEWKVVPRANPAATNFPSDFDVVIVPNSDLDTSARERLASDPRVKHVTRQRLVHIYNQPFKLRVPWEDLNA